MAISNHDRVGKALELLNKGLLPYIEQEMIAIHKDKWLEVAKQSIKDIPATKDKKNVEWDTQKILTIIWSQWESVFSKTLGRSERAIVSELRDIRNNWAHQQNFSTDDAYRSIDSVTRLLTAVAAPEAQQAEAQKKELLQIQFEEHNKKQAKQSKAATISGTPTTGLKPWREIATPHPDVASGRYQQAEFAADLWQVYRNEGGDEYKNPTEFFRRTFLTEGLLHLLKGALERVTGKGADPVIELQTNFGGGKTHSMMALYHLLSGTPISELTGTEVLLSSTGIKFIPRVNRVIIVGTRLQAGQPQKKPDGTVVKTMWGEIAWQLGGKEGYKMLKEADETATSPGDALQELLKKYSPCLILIDEWVAYARQLSNDMNLPGGTFDTHFTFAQTLTETVKSIPTALLVVSIPASDNEIGGERGKEALTRLKNAVGRVHSPWRPASTEESFEIVRRRLFYKIAEGENAHARDAVVHAFAELYRTQPQEFPASCKEADYERRLKAAYPIHPELFDRLFTDWSTLDKFQRTRGVLRFMASVIFTLWDRHDQNLLIMPSSVPIDEQHVQSELTRYLDDNWVPVLEKDVDTIPRQLDGENPNLGRYSACRRVARSIFLGSAPTLHVANRGIEDRNIKLACVQPGEAVATFGDALRRITDKATYLYLDGQRYWYSTQASVNRLAEDRSAQMSEDKVMEEIRNRVVKQCADKNGFSRIHPFPQTSADIPEDKNTRLVVLLPEQWHSAKVMDSPAMKNAQEILENRGSTPRSYRNTLVFLAVDKNRMSDLELAVRQFLAWESILHDHETLNLDPFQKKQADAKKKTSDTTVESRLFETFIFLLVPCQNDPQGKVEWQESKIQGTDNLAHRCAGSMKKLETGLAQMGPARLKHELDRVPLWKGNLIQIGMLSDYFAQYLYLPRLMNTEVLIDSIRDGISLVSWVQDSFGYAEGYDEKQNRYIGLRGGEKIGVISDTGIIVKSDVALKQLSAETAIAEAKKKGETGEYTPTDTASTHSSVSESIETEKKIIMHRFHGTIKLDVTRIGRDAGRIAEEVIQHMSGIMGSKMEISLEIHAELPDGAPDNVVRTVTENCRVLNFDSYGFEEE